MLHGIEGDSLAVFVHRNLPAASAAGMARLRFGTLYHNRDIIVNAGCGRLYHY